MMRKRKERVAEWLSQVLVNLKVKVMNVMTGIWRQSLCFLKEAVLPSADNSLSQIPRQSLMHNRKVQIFGLSLLETIHVCNS